MPEEWAIVAGVVLIGGAISACVALAYSQTNEAQWTASTKNEEPEIITEQETTNYRKAA
jgi:hypothetical protein